MTKIRERKTRDVNQVRCIKDEADQLLVKDEEIRHRWRQYFDKRSMRRMGALPLSWMTPLMRCTDVFCAANPGGRGQGGFKKDERRQDDGP